MSHEALKPEDFLIKIVGDPCVKGRHPEFTALFEVHFKLNRTPDEEWISLFDSPTSFTLNLHFPKIEGNYIIWMASAESIEGKDKDSIYERVESANTRFLPIVQQRILNKQKEQEEYLKEQTEIDKLNAALKRNKAPIIEKTNAVIMGVCSLCLNDCMAKETPGPVTQIRIGKQIQNVCHKCLKKQIENGNWRES